jgi:hypothetical protein
MFKGIYITKLVLSLVRDDFYLLNKNSLANSNKLVNGAINQQNGSNNSKTVQLIRKQFNYFKNGSLIRIKVQLDLKVP